MRDRVRPIWVSMAFGIQEMWDVTIGFYEDLVEAGEHYGPMLSLVRTMRDSDIASTFHPSTSHFGLILSRGANHAEKTKLPMLAVVQMPGGKFVVKFYSNPGKTHDLVKYHCHSTPEVCSLLQALFLRLDLISNEAREKRRTMNNEQ